MKVRVIKPFADKITFKMYGVGEIIDLPDNRASFAVSKGLVAEMAVRVPKNVETASEAKKTEKKTANKRGKDNAKQSKAGAADNIK